MNRRRSKTAAIFDLDRTLIGGPSGPVFSSHLGAAGIRQRNLPGADLVSLSYRLLGETAITAPTAQLAARATAGWPVDAVRAAAEAAADELEEHVQPYAPGVIAEHRKAGRVLVMATTSPEPLVAPFADRLGFDAVVATRWSRRGRCLHRAHRRIRGVGQGEAGGGAGVGRRGRRRPRRLVGLQRQLLRRSAARRRRPPDGRQRRRPPRRPGPPEGLAAAPLRPARRRAQDRRPRAAGVGDARSPRPATAAERPPRHRRAGEHPRHRAGHRRVQPPQLPRRPDHLDGARPRPAARSASSARRRSSTSRSSEA